MKKEMIIYHDKYIGDNGDIMEVSMQIYVPKGLSPNELRREAKKEYRKRLSECLLSMPDNAAL
jgi:hypothetical protein